MLKGNWRQFIAPAVIAVLAIGGTWFGGLVFEPRCIADSLSRETDANAEHDQPRPHYHRSVTCHANCQVQFGFDGKDSSYGDAKETANQQKEANGAPLPPVEERDLCAQARMAWWTRIIALWTAIGAILLFFALLLTRRDIEQTREIGEAQNRSYVRVLRATSTLESNEEYGSRAKYWAVVNFTIKNSGQTPAQHLAHDETAVVATLGTHSMSFGKKEPKLTIDCALSSGEEGVYTVRTDPFYDHTFQALLRDDVAIIADIALNSRDVFGEWETVKAGFFLGYKQLIGDQMWEPQTMQIYYEKYEHPKADKA